MKSKALCVFVLAGLCAGATPAGAVEWIGKTATVINSVTGKLQLKLRSLKRGDSVFRNETIETGKASRTQLLFRDESVLTVGSKSSIVLDKFVYDPKKAKGQVVVNALKGSFRFITGSAPPKSYKFKTPVATIGIRGTIFHAALSLNEHAQMQLTVMVSEGGVELCNKVGNCVFLKPGTYAIVSARSANSGKTGESGETHFGDSSDPLLIRFSGTGHPIFTDTPPTPDTNPDNPVDVVDGFSPVLTPSGNLPQGIENQINNGGLPPGLERNRDSTTFLPPGLQGRPLPPGQAKKQ